MACRRWVFPTPDFPYKKEGVEEGRSDWAAEMAAWYANLLSSYITKESNVYKSFNAALAPGGVPFGGTGLGFVRLGGFLRAEDFCAGASVSCSEATSSAQTISHCVPLPEPAWPPVSVPACSCFPPTGRPSDHRIPASGFFRSLPAGKIGEPQPVNLRGHDRLKGSCDFGPCCWQFG